MNAIKSPHIIVSINELIQLFELNFKTNADNINNVQNENMLIQNDVPNFSLKIFFAKMNCIKHVVNCTHRLVKAAPFASKIGMKIKFNARFITTPVAATMLRCFKLPLAVSNVPKIYVTDIETKLPINICNILEDSWILMLYASTVSFS